MVNFGFNANSLPLGYGMQGGYGMQTGFGQAMNFGNAFPASGIDFASALAPVQVTAERFVNSQAGGVILDSSGQPSGRIPAGSFVDTQNGTIYGNDGKQITIPEGSTVDFFDLPDLAELTGSSTGGGPADKGKGAWDPSTVAGQWGPGGVTSMPGCDHDHSTSTNAGGAKGAGPTDKGSAVAGASGGGATNGATTLQSALGALTPAIQQIQALLQSQLANVAGGGKGTFGNPTTSVAGASGGGGATQAASGAGGLGATPSLEQSLAELVSVLKQLATEVQKLSVVGGGGAPVTQVPPNKGGGPVHDHVHFHGHGRPVQKPATTATTTATTSTDSTTTTGSGDGSATTSTSTDSSSSTDTSTSTDDTSTST